jgi:hypothetical protein
MAGKPFLHHKLLPPFLFSYHQIINEWIIYHLSPRRFDLALSLAFQGQGADGIKTLSRHVQ